MLPRRAADGDSTDYAGSNATGSFATHWTRTLGIALLTSHGALLNAVGRTMYSEAARRRAAAAQRAWAPATERDEDDMSVTAAELEGARENVMMRDAPPVACGCDNGSGCVRALC